MSDPYIWAWRCEHCGKWRKPETKPVVVFVSEPGDDIVTFAYVERLRVTRRMEICEPCVKTMREDIRP